MKVLLPLLISGVVHAGGTDPSVGFIRQRQENSPVVWDMPAVPEDEATSAMSPGGALLQRWVLDPAGAKEQLVDQKRVGAYVPKAAMKLVSCDSGGKTPRTRVDQPFSLEIDMSGLLSGLNMPLSARAVVLERHLSKSQPGNEPAILIQSRPPECRAYLEQNGRTALHFQASSLTGKDATKACGEEHFVIHTIGEGGTLPTQIASSIIQVWPVASGEIKGIPQGEVILSQIQQVELHLHDLYPRSDTYLMLFPGTQIQGVEGTILKAFMLDRETSESRTLTVNGIDERITCDGTYTLALLSDTVYGRELLGDPVTFNVRRADTHVSLNDIPSP